MQADTRSWRFQELQFCGEREVHCIAAYCNTAALCCWQNLGQLGAVGTLVELFTDKAKKEGEGNLFLPLTVCVPRLAT